MVALESDRLIQQPHAYWAAMVSFDVLISHFVPRVVHVMENFVPVPARTCMLPVGRLKAATFFVFLSRSGLPLPPLRPLQYYLLNDKNLKDINSRVGKVRITEF